MVCMSNYILYIYKDIIIYLSRLIKLISMEKVTSNTMILQKSSFNIIDLGNEYANPLTNLN